MFTSEHGEGQGAHSWAQKAAFWEEVARVPLIISGAGVARRPGNESVLRDHRALLAKWIADTADDFTPARTASAGYSLAPRPMLIVAPSGCVGAVGC